MSLQCTPLLPVLRRQRQAVTCSVDQAGLELRDLSVLELKARDTTSQA